jgi:hypothetical protein
VHVRSASGRKLKEEPETVLVVVSLDSDGYRGILRPDRTVICVNPPLESVSPFGEPKMNPAKIVIRFEQVSEQTEGPVRRIVGFVRAKNMLQLFDAADLEANPREAKAGAVTADIIDSICETPETFPFKTKGVLVGASNYNALERKRYEIRFENTKIEGILDGGHNMLAIGTYVLARALGDDRIFKKIKRWTELKDAWAGNRAEITELKRVAGEESGNGPLDFLVPVEVLVPADITNADTVDEFNSSLLDICAARNNNVELTLETKANKKGFYEYLRKSLQPSIANRVEWKTNDGGEIKVRDLIALAWIPMSVIDLPVDFKIPPQNLYRNKGELAKHFDTLMSDERVSSVSDGDYTHELHNTAVHSALVIAGELPELYDKIYRDFPAAYNGDRDGRFGGLAVVKMADKMRSKPRAHFTDVEVDYAYPDGLIMPLVYGLKALMAKDANGNVHWKEDPFRFLDEHLESIVKKYRVILDAFRADPQKVGKNEGSYDLVLDAFETEVLKRQAVAASARGPRS